MFVATPVVIDKNRNDFSPLHAETPETKMDRAFIIVKYCQQLMEKESSGPH
jgi:hypothetical protein